MDSINVDLVRAELVTFVELTEPVEHDLPPDPPEGATVYWGPRAPTTELVYAMQGIETILERVLPRWRSYLTGPDHSWGQRRNVAIRALAQLDRGAALDAMLGDGAPTLRGGRLQPWVWEGARSMWQSQHYRQAVVDAAKRINAELQNKMDTRATSETALTNLAFSEQAPTPVHVRLRLPEDDGGKTALSVRRGIRCYAEGCFAAIRNPSTHDVQDELPEHEALEQLAALSVLARWIDRAQPVTA